MTERTATTSRRGLFRAGAGAAAAAAVGGTASADTHEAWADDIREYLSDVDDGEVEIEDMREQDTVEVEVGAGENGLRFAPKAIQVSPGTTVEWVWTGQGGGHNVYHDDALEGVDERAFDSGDLVNEEGHTFEHTFEEAGRFRYACEPHKGAGMKGGVLVSDADLGGGSGDSSGGISPVLGGAAAIILSIPLLAAFVLMLREMWG